MNNTTYWKLFNHANIMGSAMQFCTKEEALYHANSNKEGEDPCIEIDDDCMVIWYRGNVRL